MELRVLVHLSCILTICSVYLLALIWSYPLNLLHCSHCGELFNLDKNLLSGSSWKKIVFHKAVHFAS